MMTQEERETLRKCGRHVILEQGEGRTNIYELKNWMRKAREIGVKLVDRQVEDRTGAGTPLRLPSWERELSSCDFKGILSIQDLD